MKFIEPAIEETPARCSLKINMSTLEPGWPEVDRVGYNVQPVPHPVSQISDRYENVTLNGRIQKLKLFKRG